MKRTLVGEHIVIDPEICHGVPTFRGTRIFVSDIIDDVASGLPWGEIAQRWHGDVTPAAIAEAIRLAGEVFADHAHEYTLLPASA